MAISKFGEFEGIRGEALKTCLFMPNGLSTWSFFANNYKEEDRKYIIRNLIDWQMNGMIFLLSNTDPECPVEFFYKWGGEFIPSRIELLLNYAKLFYDKRAYFVPCIFCDDGDNWKYQRASESHQDRSIGFLITILRPYIAGVLIGLESSEYFNKQEHEFFIRLIKRYAPDVYIGTHLQKEPSGGMPQGLDFVAYEHSWSPLEGDKHTPEEVVNEVREVEARWKLPIMPVEYNTNVKGQRIKEQSRALLRAGYGCGGPY